MKIVRLKQKFVEQAIEVDNEFLDKHTRSYMYIKVQVESIDYLIPFRSNVSHHYCYKFSSNNLDNKYIDFTKSIPLYLSSENRSTLSVENGSTIKLVIL